MSEPTQAAPAVKTYKTRAAVLNDIERSALAFAVREGIVIDVYQVRGGYEARAHHMGPPRETSRHLRTIDGPALRKANEEAAAAEAARSVPSKAAELVPPSGGPFDDRPAGHGQGQGQRGHRGQR